MFDLAARIVPQHCARSDSSLSHSGHRTMHSPIYTVLKKWPRIISHRKSHSTSTVSQKARGLFVFVGAVVVVIVIVRVGL